MASSSQQSVGTGSNMYVEVVPLTLHIGAEIRGVDLNKPLPPQQLKEVRDAFLKWKVVFFRGQHLDHAQHVAMARQFGEPTIGHAVFGHVEGYPEIYSVAKNRTANENREAMMVTPWSGWHTDITAAVNPPCASILRGVTIPPYGGDTFWTNLAAAYNGLSPTMRGFVDGLRGIHKFVPRENPKAGSEYNERIRRRALTTEHPLVTVHAETGERVLFASPSFLKSVVGLTPRESQKLLELLWEHVTRPEYTVRFKWNTGDIAFWDNRSTSHLAPTDIFQSDFDRQLYRITLVGQPLVGVDGQPSKAIEGLPILSAAEELRMMAAAE
jgi:alpha-ketoglutarate-dependent sulfate ester dioxygenase